MPQYDAYEEPSPITIPHISHTHADISLPLPTSLLRPATRRASISHPTPILQSLQTPLQLPPTTFTAGTPPSLETTGPVRILSHQPRHPSPASTPRRLSTWAGSEQKQLAEFEASQKQDDEISIMTACDHYAPEKAAAGAGVSANPCDCDPTGEFNHEVHMLNGGWIHRTRASCERLSERH
jgi:hypothetical protein